MRWNKYLVTGLLETPNLYRNSPGAAITERTTLYRDAMALDEAAGIVFSLIAFHL